MTQVTPLSNSTPRIVVIGTGYVGLVSGTCFAEMGHHVTCIDVDSAKIDALKNKGVIPIYEPGLEDLVKKNTAAGRLHFTTNYADAVPQADAVFIAVGTPQGDDGRADLRYVDTAAKSIAENLKGYTVIVNKSTVPVGTAERVKNIIAQHASQADFDVVSNPEFLREGHAIEDFMHGDRIIVGAESVRALAVMRALYTPLTNNGMALMETTPSTSEMIKYAGNAYLAMKITYINEIAALCDACGADVTAVADGIGLDHRIGRAFLNPGPGYGGSCFPKDTHAMARIGQDNGTPLALIETVIRRNEEIKKSMAARVVKACGGSLNGKTVAVLGLAFKAHTDDMRDAPSLSIVPELVAQGATVKAYDPQAMKEAAHLLKNITLCNSAEEAMRGADATLIITEWPEFSTLDWQQAATWVNAPVCVDLRNILESKTMASYGWQYSSLGRPSTAATPNKTTKVA